MLVVPFTCWRFSNYSNPVSLSNVVTIATTHLNGSKTEPNSLRMIPHHPWRSATIETNLAPRRSPRPHTLPAKVIPACTRHVHAPSILLNPGPTSRTRLRDGLDGPLALLVLPPSTRHLVGLTLALGSCAALLFFVAGSLALGVL